MQQITADNDSITFEELCKAAIEANHKVLSAMAVIERGFRPMSAQELQEWLLVRRKTECLSLRQLAKVTGVSTSTLCRIENGKPFDWDTGQAVLRWLSDESSVGTTEVRNAR